MGDEPVGENKPGEELQSVVARVFDVVTALGYDPARIGEVEARLVHDLVVACRTPMDHNQMRQTITALMDHDRHRGYWLAYLNQLAAHQSGDLTEFLPAALLYADAQLLTNEDLGVHSLETALVNLVRVTDATPSLAPHLAGVRCSLEARLLMVRRHYDRLYSGDNVPNPLMDHPAAELAWIRFTDRSPWLWRDPDTRPGLETVAPEELRTSVDRHLEVGSTSLAASSYRFLGLRLSMSGAPLPDVALAYSAGLDLARVHGVASEVGHLFRLLGYTRRKEGHLDEAALLHLRAIDHEADPVDRFAYWRGLSLRELGDCLFERTLQRVEAVKQGRKPPAAVSSISMGPLEPYRLGRIALERHLRGQTLPVSRGVAEELALSFGSNALVAAAGMGSLVDLLAEFEANGPRMADDIHAEYKLGDGTDPETRAAIRAGRLGMLRLYGPEKIGQDAYLADVGNPVRYRERTEYVRARKQARQARLDRYDADCVAQRILDLPREPICLLLSEIGRQRSMLVLVDLDEGEVVAHPFASVTRQDLRRAHEAYRRLAATPDREPLAPAMSGALEGLLAIHDRLFGEFLRAQADRLRGRRLVVFPRYEMNAVPYHALPVDGSVLGEFVPVSYCQTLAQFLASHRRPSHPVSPPPRIVLDERSQDLACFQVLKSEHRQACAAGTPRAVIDALAGAEVGDVVLACHGRHHPERPTASALRFPGSGDLSFLDLFSALGTVDADCVVLAACESGLARTAVAAEYIGLPAPFLGAGARTVIANLWEVNPISTAFLVSRYLVHRRTPGVSPSAALQSAQADCRVAPANTIVAWLETTDMPYLRQVLPHLESGIRGLGSAPFSHPYYWAGFGAFGGA